MHGGGEQADKLFSGANQTAAEAFSNIRTVAAFQMEGSIAALYTKLLRVARLPPTPPTPACSATVSRLACLYTACQE